MINKKMNIKNKLKIPPKKNILTSNKGINRFVWDMRHSLLKGVPEVYIEGSFKGHKVIPGEYKVNLSYRDKSFEITSQIIKNPMNSVSNRDYKLYDEFMTNTEKVYNEMSTMTNDFYKIKNQLNLLKTELITAGKNKLAEDAQNLIFQIKKWDNIMVQRLSQAYDDVENFENGFTAHYLTLINSIDSDLPVLNSGAKNKLNELNIEWEIYKNQAINTIKPQIDQFNVDCAKNGIGPIFISSN